MNYTVAIDLGGTVTKIGLLCGGKLCDFTRMESHSSKGLEFNLPRLKESIDGLLSKHSVATSQLNGIGIAFPGLANPVNGRVLSTNDKYTGATTFDLNGWVAQNWSVPFYIDNDARMAAAGEWQAGAGKGKENMVMVTLGTGIGTGVVIDGHILYGKHFQAGVLGGHFALDYKGRDCNCGNKGCIESMAASCFLTAIITEHPDLSAAFKARVDRLDFKTIFAIAAEGDADALLLRNECMDIWSAAIVTYIHAYDPEVIVMGGGVMKSADVIIPYIKAKADRMAWCPLEKVPITVAELGDNAALYGLDYCLKQRNN